MENITIVNKNNIKLHIITKENIEKSKLKQYIMDNNARLFGDKRYYLDKHSKKINYNILEKSSIERNYLVSFIYENVAQCVKVSSYSVIGAFNDLVNTYGILDDITVVIIDLNNNTTKKSSVEYAKIIINDNTINELIIRALAEISDSNKLRRFSMEVNMLISILNNKINRNLMRYKLYIIATFIYIVDSCQFEFDINEGTVGFDREQALRYTIDSMKHILLNN